MEEKRMSDEERRLHDIMNARLPDAISPFIYMNSEDLFSHIQVDLQSAMIPDPFASLPDPPPSLSFLEEIYCSRNDIPITPMPRVESDEPSPIVINNEVWIPDVDDPHPISGSYFKGRDDLFFSLDGIEPDLNLPEAYAIMVNPRNGEPVDLDQIVNLLPQEMVKPYHPTQDHDYTDKIEEQLQGPEKLDVDTAEPEVDVWKIENFADEQAPLPHPDIPKGFQYNLTVDQETRRTSKRTADLKRRDQARLVSNAVHAVLNPKKPGKARRYKNIRPKNSVETTPSQSDIEEWHSQAVRPTCSKITKKKTTKGRIDHSASERHRREVLRRHFHLLRGLIPTNFLMGEKATSQISKQRILTGAKGFIANLYNYKITLRSTHHQNAFLKEEFLRKNSCKLSKGIKRQRTF